VTNSRTQCAAASAIDADSGAMIASENQHICSRSHDAVIRVYDEIGTVIETHEHKGDFKEW